jgi:hypothetical protein
VAELWPGGPIELPHTITLDGLTLTLPATPTFDLLHLMATGSWWNLLPNALPPQERATLLARVFDDEDPLDFEHLWDPAVTLLGRLAGTASRHSGGTGWWPAIRMCAWALGDWPLFNAWCAEHGLDIAAAPPWRATGAIYGWLRTLTPAENLANLEQEIWAPPPFAVASTSVDELPRHVRDEEAALALAALRETLPGEDRVTEWTPPPAP